METSSSPTSRLPLTTTNVPVHTPTDTQWAKPGWMIRSAAPWQTLTWCLIKVSSCHLATLYTSTGMTQMKQQQCGTLRKITYSIRTSSIMSRTQHLYSTHATSNLISSVVVKDMCHRYHFNTCLDRMNIMSIPTLSSTMHFFFSSMVRISQELTTASPTQTSSALTMSTMNWTKSTFMEMILEQEAKQILMELTSVLTIQKLKQMVSRPYWLLLAPHTKILTNSTGSKSL